MKKFYAVQVGYDCDCGYGSTVKREAIKMANAFKRDHRYDGEEIRIAVCTTDSDYVFSEIIVREGNRI